MKTILEFGAWIILIGMMLIVSTVHADTLRIGVIDTGLNLQDERFIAHLCSTGHMDFTGTGLKDTNGHGTHVAGLIQKYAGDSDYCLVIIKYSSGKEMDMDQYLAALKEALAQRLSIINMSLSGEGSTREEQAIICNHEEVSFVVAAGNEGLDLDEKRRYPASYPCDNIRVVGAKLLKKSNYGSIVTDWEDGINILSTLPDGKEGRLTGTSMSCAIATGKLIYAKTH